MSEYSEQDLKYASEFREGVHRDALAIVRKTRPHITEVVDRHPVEDYFQEHWDYPGKWYTIVAIPSGYGSREALIDAIVRDTLTADGPSMQREPGRRKLSKQLDGKPDGYRKLFTVDVDQNSRSCRVVGVDAEGRHILEHYEEYNVGSAYMSMLFEADGTVQAVANEINGTMLGTWYADGDRVIVTIYGGDTGYTFDGEHLVEDESGRVFFKRN